MNRDDIIRMAREAWKQTGENWVVPHWFDERAASFERFAALVAAAEREECAKVCDVTPPYPFRPSIEAAHAIRARSNT